MIGHYVYGLLFSVLTFYFFACGVRESRIYFSLVAAGFYALACWSKELYVPIIAILIFLPESNWKVRFRHEYWKYARWLEGNIRCLGPIRCLPDR